MSDLTFAQSERRSFLLPALIAISVLGLGCVLAYLYASRHTVTLAVTHVAILPTHTVFKTGSKVVGHQDPFEDDLYVLASVRIDDHLRVPLFLKDITATLTASDDSILTTSAIEQNDLANLYLAFPALKSLASAPLLRESTIQPGDHGEGMVILHFPIAEAEWNQRKSASITLDFYHQDPLTVPIPKP
jgi:hypothetical protein